MKLRGLIVLLVAGGLRTPAGADPANALPLLSPDAMHRHIATLSSDEYEGRAPGTHGGDLTVAYLLGELKRLGAEPADPAGTYLQPVPLVGIRSIVAGVFSAGGHELVLEYGRDYLARSYVQRPELTVDHAELVFAGYGIVAPEFGWDDYKSTDVRGKVVIVVDGEPTAAAPGAGAAGQPAAPSFFQGERQTYYSTTTYKYEQARKRGAAAVFILNSARTSSASLTVLANNYRQEGFDLATDATGVPPCAVQGRLTRVAFARLGQAAGVDVAALLSRAALKEFASTALGVTASFQVHNELRSVTAPNIVAKVAGTDPRRQSDVIVYTAHWDHLGRDDKLPGDKIYNGALDNAAGVAQLLGIVELFLRAKERPACSVLFLFTTAEEKGYLGARYYVQHPLYPLARTLANINLDDGNVWGRTADVINLGAGLTTLDEGLATSAAGQQRTFFRDPYDDGSYFFKSDQIEFARVGVPAVFPGSGTNYRGRPSGYGDQKWGEYGRKGYHQVGDEIQGDWVYTGLIEDAEWLWRFGQDLTRASVWPQWQPDAGFGRKVTN